MRFLRGIASRSITSRGIASHSITSRGIVLRGIALLGIALRAIALLGIASLFHGGFRRRGREPGLGEGKRSVDERTSRRGLCRESGAVRACPVVLFLLLVLACSLAPDAFRRVTRLLTDVAGVQCHHHLRCAPPSLAQRGGRDQPEVGGRRLRPGGPEWAKDARGRRRQVAAERSSHQQQGRSQPEQPEQPEL